MNNFICFLVTVINLKDESLVRVLLKFEADRLSSDIIRNPMAHKDKLHSMLPYHVRQMGPIVEVDHIYDAIFYG